MPGGFPTTLWRLRNESEVHNTLVAAKGSRVDSQMRRGTAWTSEIWFTWPPPLASQRYRRSVKVEASGMATNMKAPGAENAGHLPNAGVEIFKVFQAVIGDDGGKRPVGERGEPRQKLSPGWQGQGEWPGDRPE